MLASCLKDSAGPGEARRGSLGIAPVFESRALMLVDFERVRIRLLRPGANTVALDTVVDFPAGQDSIELNLTVLVQG
ncbi:MAG: hypothetical protein Q7J79_00765, partial [Gemmatimonadales bacterium]|nr:hypothetical protein [Gemmatimonadales bacterium]